VEFSETDFLIYCFREKRFKVVIFSLQIKKGACVRVTLRPYQYEAVSDIRSSFSEGYKAPLVVLPTGGGKTVIFSYVTERTALNNNDVMLLVHRDELLRQTSDHLDSLGLRHGMISAGKSMTGDRVQIASVQTLVRRLDRVKPPKLLIIDEAHHTNAGSWRKVIDAWPKTLLLGVTATPMRMDGTGLGKHAGGYFDKLIEGPTIRELIDMGFLAQPIVYAPPTGFNVSGIKIKMGEYEHKEVEHRIDKPHITGCAIEHYQRICPGVPAIAFCASVAHAEHVADQFNQAGIPAAAIDSKLSYAVRKYRIASLASGQIKVLTSCDIISEGTDIPVVTAAIMLRPTHSTGLFMQQGGRALRIHPNKTHAIILDHVGNCMRHGLLDDERSWSLDGVKKKKKQDEDELKIKVCKKCFAVFANELTHCPQCGTEYKAIIGSCPAGLSGRDIKQVAGQLVEIGRDELLRIKKDRRREVGMAKSLEDLIEIGMSRGYHPKWAERIWISRQMSNEPSYAM
jgi:DNA repair protein RadD